MHLSACVHPLHFDVYDGVAFLYSGRFLSPSLCLSVVNIITTFAVNKCV